MTDLKNPFGLSRVKSVIAVASCKGGVGKSTVAAGLARALSAGGAAVGLLDADIHGPSMPTLFGIKDAGVAVNEFRMWSPVRAQGLVLMSFGFLLGDAPAVMRGPIVTRYIQQMLLQTDWGALDYLIIDMPPGTGDVALTVTQSIRISGAVIVTTPQTLSLVDVARGILMFERVKVPVLGTVVNMAKFLCDGCGQEHRPFGRAVDTQAHFGVPMLVEIPLAQPEALAPFWQQLATALPGALRAVGNGPKLPLRIDFDAERIALHFEDGHSLEVDNALLRRHCMCALCLDEITGKPRIDLDHLKPDIAAKEVTPLGHYALSIVWNDGHSSGIYPYTMIRSLAHSAPAS